MAHSFPTRRSSDLLSLVALWDYLREQQRQLSSNQFRRLCRSEYLNYLRVREWHDLFSQLRHVAGELRIRAGSEAGHPDHVHQAVLAGLLSHIGMRDRDRREFRGARGASFLIDRGSVLARKSPPWVMAAELVETNRLWARRAAAVQPEWAERVGAHLVKRSYGEPVWDQRAGRAVTTETVTLYGLPIVSGRTVGYDRVDAAGARELFIRHALVLGEWDAHHEFLRRNREFVDEVGALEDRVRRGHLLDDDAVETFYDARLPADLTSTRHFERWWRDIGGDDGDDRQRLDLTVDALRKLDGAAIDLDDYPSQWRHGDLALALAYRFAPGEPLDGVTVRIPLAALNQVGDEGFDWQIPGYRAELVHALARTLPKDIRRSLIPAAETVAAAYEKLGAPAGPLADALAAALATVTGVPIRAGDFDARALPDHLRVHFVVVDESGTVHDAGDDLAAIRRRLASTAREAIAAAAPIDERRGIVTWDVGVVPRVVETIHRYEQGGVTVRGYPALLDDDDSVSLRVFTKPDLQQRVMRGGVLRLLLLTAAPSIRAAERELGNAARLAISAAGTTPATLAGECVAATIGHLLDRGELPWDPDAFADWQARVRHDAAPIAGAALRVAADVLMVASAARVRLDGLVADSLTASVTDARAHLDRLIRPGFVNQAGVRRLTDVLRYVRGIELRLGRLAEDVARDRRRIAEVVPLERRHADFVARLGRASGPAEVVDIGWQLEELRVAVFAQQLGARGGVSASKVARRLTALGTSSLTA